MGASSWAYFVPYDSDIHAALERLRQDVFRRGDYYLREGRGQWDEADAGGDWGLWTAADELGDWERWSEAEERIEMGEDPAPFHADQEGERTAQSHPGSIDELLEWNEESGTHSIIDMTSGVSDTPAFGTVSPLTNDQLQAELGTTTPTHEQVEQWAKQIQLDPIGNLRRRWQGLYMIVYDGKVRSEIYFAGFSGD